MRELKFRVWDHQEKSFELDSSFWIYQSGVLDHDYKILDRKYTIQQYTGLKDKNKKEIYEGDILNMKYFVGDFAWENMTEEEADRNMKMEGKEYVVEVKQSLVDGINLELVAKIDIGNGLIYFPLVYIKNSVKIGNIFEDHELLITNKL